MSRNEYNICFCCNFHQHIVDMTVCTKKVGVRWLIYSLLINCWPCPIWFIIVGRPIKLYSTIIVLFSLFSMTHLGNTKKICIIEVSSH